MPNERNHTVFVQCRMCGRLHKLKVCEEDFKEYKSSSRRKIQEIFPYLTPAERELFISHTCETCWNEMFKDFDEE